MEQQNSGNYRKKRKILVRLTLKSGIPFCRMPFCCFWWNTGPLRCSNRYAYVIRKEFLSLRGVTRYHGKRNNNPLLVGHRKAKYVIQIGSNTTKLWGFITSFFQWQMYEWLFLYVPLRFLFIVRRVLPETEDAWQDMFLYLGRHRSGYFNGRRRSVIKNKCSMSVKR